MNGLAVIFAVMNTLPTMPLLTPAELMRLLKENLPAIDHHGEVIEEVLGGTLRMRLPVVDSYVSHDLPVGSGQVVLSGPLMMGFADTAMYACVHAFYGRNVFAAMVNFSVSFFRIAGHGDIKATVRLLKRGKSLAFVETFLYSTNNVDPCAHITATYSVRNIGR